MFWLNFIFKFIKTLHSKEDPHNIAMGFALGSFIGLAPFFTLQNVFVFILILILNVSIGAAFFAILFFGCFAYLFDPQFHSLGYFLLVKIDSLKPIWTYLYNIPIAPLSKFYNTLVMGSLAVSLVAFFPIYLAFKQLVKVYQSKMAAKVDQFKIMQLIKGNKLFQLYQKIKLQ